MKKILPVETNPLFISSFETSVYFSIIKAQAELNKKDITPWLICQMANYRFNCNSLRQFDIIKNENWYAGIKLFFKRDYLFDVRIPGWDKSKIREIIQLSIDNKRYVHIKADAYYLKSDPAYKLIHIDVDCLIYGYDSEKELFYYLQHRYNNPLVFYESSISEMTEAACSRNCFRVNIDTLIYNRDFDFSFSEKTLYNSIYDFLNSTKQLINVVPDNKEYYGLEAFEKLRDYLKSIANYNDFLDWKVYSTFYDFQLASIYRCKFFLNNNYIADSKIAREVLYLSEISDTFLNKCKKYNFERNVHELAEIIELFDLIVNSDVLISKTILKTIKELVSSSDIINLN